MVAFVGFGWPPRFVVGERTRVGRREESRKEAAPLLGWRK
jgi:hypothetical protein